MTGPLTVGKSYTVTCTGPNGTAGNDVYVNINGSLTIFPNVSVIATPLTITSGSTSTISWSSNPPYSTSCNAGVGNGTGTSGSFTTTALTEGKSFVVICTGPNGTNSGSVYVGVIPATTTNPVTPIVTTNVTIASKGVCPANAPLVFTDEEQKQLDILSRKFYLLAPTIKTEDDVNLSSAEIIQQQNLLDHVKGLTKECYLETNANNLYTSFCSINPTYCDNVNDKFAVPAFTGDTTRFGNPWYLKTTRGFYMTGATGDNNNNTDYNNFELMFNIW